MLANTCMTLTCINIDSWTCLTSSVPAYLHYYIATCTKLMKYKGETRPNITFCVSLWNRGNWNKSLLTLVQIATAAESKEAMFKLYSMRTLTIFVIFLHLRCLHPFTLRYDLELVKEEPSVFLRDCVEL